jgi:hypothetical protein
LTRLATLIEATQLSEEEFQLLSFSQSGVSEVWAHWGGLLL